MHQINLADLTRITQSSGQPTRLHQQLRKLEEIYGKRNDTGEVIERGHLTTAAAKTAEIARLQNHFDTTGTVPEGNKKSFKPRGECV